MNHENTSELHDLFCLNGRFVMHLNLNLCGGWLAGWRLGWMGNEQGSVDAQDIPWADVM
jgi:hypothetical protein